MPNTAAQRSIHNEKVPASPCDHREGFLYGEWSATDRVHFLMHLEHCLPCVDYVAMVLRFEVEVLDDNETNLGGGTLTKQIPVEYIAAAGGA